jgi:cytochrome c oxidase subunit 3
LPTLDERTGTYVQDWLTVNLPLATLTVNTLVLAASSITMELARRQTGRRAVLTAIRSVPGVSVGEEQQPSWLALTVVLGLAFLAGQCFAWRQLAHRGFYLATSPSSSFVYLLTATHAVHLAGGLLVLLYAFAVSLLHKPIASRYIVIDTAAWYWHFMALLWIYIFAFLEFAR